MASFLSKLIIAGVLGGIIFIYNSQMFERDLPTIEIQNSGYWNLKKPLTLSMADSSGIKSYSVVLINGDKRIALSNEQFLQPKTELDLSIEAPKHLFNTKEKNIKIEVVVNDASQWDFFSGNTASASVSMIVDKKRPFLSNVTNSYGIRKGGSALVVFKASDENLNALYLETNTGKRFNPQPFYKEGYYASLVAWSVLEKTFRVNIIAKDKAGNISKASVPFHLKSKKYRVSKIKLSDRFLNGKIAQLADIYEETQGVEDSIEQFKIINEDVRAKNEILIHEITSKVSDNMIKRLPIRPFYPLKNAAVVASFGDHRLYYYKGEKVSESYHLGLDLASVKMGDIKTQNPAIVVHAAENGIYGNMPILHHGMGLYTLYGHCSSMNVQEGDSIKGNTLVANSGRSGYAMGDHLHFGVLVQGVEVRPEEWMDKQWIKLNIENVMSNAKQIINR